MASLKYPTPSVIELITKEPLTAVPQKYIRPDQEPIALSHGGTLPTVPMIDMKKLVLGDATDLELEKLHFTCKDWGLFQVLNTITYIYIFNTLCPLYIYIYIYVFRNQKKKLEQHPMKG
jgi:hypothetical protein